MSHFVHVDRENQEPCESPAEECPVEAERQEHREEGRGLGEPNEQELAFRGQEGEHGLELPQQQADAAECGEAPGRVLGPGFLGSVGCAPRESADALGELGVLAGAGRKQDVGIAPGLERVVEAPLALSGSSVPSERFEASLRDDTQLASIMHINNETGAVQDIAKLGAICKERGVLFHVDAAQSVGKVEIDLATTPVDLLSLTAHKFYGPKGIGALYVAKGTPLIPQMFGGGQQRRIRPGTLAVDLIAGLGEAAEIAAARYQDDLKHLAAEKNRLLQGLRDIDGLHINGPQHDGYPGILNVGVEDIDGESLLLALEPLCVATGSACNSQSQEPSYVLRALGRSDREAQSAIRFSLGRQTSSEDIERAIVIYRNAVQKLRDLAPERVA